MFGKCYDLHNNVAYIITGERSGSVVECLTRDERPRVRASPASLRCGPWGRHIYPGLVLVQPRETLPCLTERLLMGQNKHNNKIIKFYARNEIISYDKKNLTFVSLYN